MANKNIVLSLDIAGVRKHISGKVREVFDLDESLLIVATDRISAFDVVLPSGIPDKGKVLTQLSLYWFDRLSDVVPSHVVTTDIVEIAKVLCSAGATVDENLIAALDGRAMLVRSCDALPIECVARGYISGSLWKEYKQFPAHGGEVVINGVALPAGLRESDKLPEPIFTPATKAKTGHDENVCIGAVEEVIGAGLARHLRDATLELYRRAADHARERGIIIADTKFEFGLVDGDLIWIDEALTPDSSRFWDEKSYKPGFAQSSFDKQFVRDYLEGLDWDKTYPGPELPADVVEKTSEKYREAYKRITGQDLA
jgi:phosphoribosylaminoimidazole-succinocarboxamide synthase